MFIAILLMLLFGVILYQYIFDQLEKDRSRDNNNIKKLQLIDNQSKRIRMDENESQVEYIDAHRYPDSIQIELKEKHKMQRKLLETVRQIYYQRSAFDKFKDHIESTFRKVVHNETIITILANYISTSPKEFFLDDDYWRLFEFNVFSNNSEGKGLIWCNDSDIQYIKNLEAEKTLNPKAVDEVTAYIDNYFNMLIRLIKKHVSLNSETEYVFLVLKLFQQSVVSYSSLMYERLYGQYFSNIDSLTFVECVDIFYNNNDIPSDGVIFRNCFVYYLMGKGKFENNTNFLRCKETFDKYLLKEEENIKFRAFEKKLVRVIPTQPCSYTINDIDLMSGIEFEEFVGELFSRIGYHTKITQHSYDQGIDIIAERDGIKIGIQTKRYSGNVSNSAIQEIVAGLSFHGCSKGIVVTNSYFTKSARELADSNNIKLWDRKLLGEKITEYF